MMDLRTRLLFMIGVPLLAIGVLVIGLLLRPNAQVADDGENVDQLPAAGVPDMNDPVDVPDQSTRPVTTGVPYQPTSPEEKADIYAAQIARNFVERFYSYSNQSNNQHILDVLPLATESMAVWIQGQTVPNVGAYEGVTTKVVSATVKERTPSSAIIAVGVQQKMSKAGSSDEVVYKNGRVELSHLLDEWYVNAVYWE